MNNDAVVKALRGLLAETDPYRLGRGTEAELRARREAVAALNAYDSAALAAAPADDWTVSASETAREVLNYLGTGSDPSLEPGADRRRDNVAKIITKHFDALAAAPASAPEPVEIKQLEWIAVDKRHEAKTILGTYRAIEISPGYTNLSCEVGETRFSLGDDWKQISLEAAKAAAQANFEARIRSALVTT